MSVPDIKPIQSLRESSHHFSAFKPISNESERSHRASETEAKSQNNTTLQIQKIAGNTFAPITLNTRSRHSVSELKEKFDAVEREEDSKISTPKFKTIRRHSSDITNPSIKSKRSSLESPTLGTIDEDALLSEDNDLINLRSQEERNSFQSRSGSFNLRVPSPFVEHPSISPSSRISPSLSPQSGSEPFVSVRSRVRTYSNASLASPELSSPSNAELSPRPIPLRATPILIPELAKKLLENFYHKQLDNHPDENTKDLITTKLQNANQAFSLFEQMGCRWLLMKRTHGNTQEMQIINDLRAAYLEHMFDQLRAEYGSIMAIEDFGSSNPTSDRDISFVCHRGDEHEEPMISNRFMKLFEREWNATSSTVFDTNPYTAYHTKLIGKDFAKKQLALHSKMSLVMFKLNTQDHNPLLWESFKQDVLKNLNGSIKMEKAALFSEVEKECNQLKQTVQKSILTHDENLKNDLEIDAVALDEIRQKAHINRLRAQTPDIDIQVKEDLHYSIRQKAHSLYSDRINIENFLTRLNFEGVFRVQQKKNETESSQKEHSLIKVRDELIKNAIHRNEVKIDELNKTISNLNKELELITLEIRRLKSNNQDTSALENKQNATIRSKNNLQNTIDRTLFLQNKELDEFRDKPWPSLKEFDAYRKHMTLMNGKKNLEKEKALLEKNSSSSHNEENPKLLLEIDKITSKIDDLDDQIQLVETSEPFKNFKIKIPIEKFQLITDELWIEQQEIDLRGKCYQQEIHISEGAYLFTVKDIQQHLTEPRSIGHYMQAFNELLAFYFDHQNHLENPNDKMIECSKYIGPRIFELLKRMRHQAKRKNFPDLENIIVNHNNQSYALNFENLKNYFNELYPLRGNQKSLSLAQKHEIASSLAKKYHIPCNVFGSVDVNILNKYFLEMMVKLHCWESSLKTNDLI